MQPARRACQYYLTRWSKLCACDVRPGKAGSVSNPPTTTRYGIVIRGGTVADAAGRPVYEAKVAADGYVATIKRGHWAWRRQPRRNSGITARIMRIAISPM